MNFKAWFENEYDPPNEKEMDRIRNTPLRADNPPSLKGDHYRFRMPLGNTQHFMVRFGAIAGLQAPVGSLNVRCAQLFQQNKFRELHKLLQFYQFNSNPVMRKQVFFRES
ncbi:MAG: hypothetical protein DWQ19_11545 [Crenarchaeota archaeon]|nr:MAG: hypothetical protein DWQ19_11545 [Thermoproteota archaeon]